MKLRVGEEKLHSYSFEGSYDTEVTSRVALSNRNRYNVSYIWNLKFLR